MSRKKTHEEFVKELYELHPQISTKDIYKTNDTKMHFKCEKDNFEWDTKPISVIKNGCACCNGHVKNEYIYINDLKRYGINIELIGTYKNYQTKATHRCLDCGHVFESSPTKVVSNFKKGVSNCRKCSDGISIPNKFVANVLEYIGIDFKTEKRFLWSNNKQYDIYIPNSIIIENHGIQHYEASYFNKLSNKTLLDIQSNDIYKETIAKENGIHHYVILDCRYSEMEYIKQSIMKSELPKLYNFTEENVDWNECFKKTLNSKVIECCELWNNGLNNAYRIAEKLHISYASSSTFLKRCAELGMCNYNPEEETIKSYSKMKEAISVQIKCENTGEIFSNIQEASTKYGIQLDSISACCSGLRYSAGKINNEKAVWNYTDKTMLNKIKNRILNYKDIKIINDNSNSDEKCALVLNLWKQINDVSIIHKEIGLSINSITRYLNRCNKLGLCNYDGSYECNKNKQRKVKCITTNKVFNSITEAEKFYNINGIWKNCSGNASYCGVFNGNKLIWRYFDESTLLEEQGA